MTDAKIHSKDHPQYPIKEQLPIGPLLAKFLKKYGWMLLLGLLMFAQFVLPRLLP